MIDNSTVFIQALAERFGLTSAVAADGRSASVFFIGDRATETVFKQVVGYLAAETDVTNWFHVDSRIPGVYARGFTDPASSTPLHLVVIGGPEAQFALLRPTMRG